MHDLTFTSSLINCSNASISICCRKLLHMTLTGFGLKSTSSRNQLKRSRQVLKPVRGKQLSCKLQLLWSLHQYNFFLCFRNMLLSGMKLTTSRKESTSTMSSLKPHKRGRRLNF
jgi:hypothetical protein